MFNNSEQYEYIFAIYSCQKYLKRAEDMYITFLRGQLPSNIKVIIIIGEKNNTSIEYKIINDLYLILNIEDTYEELSNKSIQLFRNVYTLFPNCIGCFKCDDDMLPNVKHLQKMVSLISQYKPNYFGKLRAYCQEEQHHVGKTTNGIITPYNIIIPEGTEYCGGPLYYLSRLAMSCFLNQYVEKYICEDVTIGYHLHKNRICFSEFESIYTNYFEYINTCSVHNRLHKPILYVRIDGGLGNQLFQIASAYSLAKRNDMQMIIIPYECRNKHVKNNYEYFYNIFNGLIHIRDNILQIQNIYNEPATECFSYNSNILPDKSNIIDTYLCGYFQNEKYFIDYKKEICEMFIKKHIINRLFEQYPNVENSYFIHIRRGDYVNHPLYVIDNDKYYTKAISQILKNNINTHFFIFSNDIEYCKKYSVLANIRKTFIENLSDVESLFMMSLCKKGGICTNSTFSWWGSYLNNNPDKKIYFPNKWFNNPNIPSNDIYYSPSILVDA